MATVILRDDELDGDLPDLCVMCGDDTDGDVRLTLRESAADGPARSLKLDVPYCGRCRRLRRQSAGGVHEPRVVRIDGPPLSVRLAGVDEEFVDALDDQRDGRRRPAKKKKSPAAAVTILITAVGCVLGFLFVNGLSKPARPAGPVNNLPPGWQPAARFGPAAGGGPPGRQPVNPRDPFAGQR